MHVRIAITALALGAAALAAPAHARQVRDPGGPAPRADLDFSGIDAFWAVQEALSGGVEPPGEAWDRLFETPGYALLEERERRRGMLTEAFRLAYRPDAAEGPDAAVPGAGWIRYVLPHLREVPAVRDSLEAFRRAITDEDFLGAALARAQTLLPPGTTERVAPPPISFIFFAPDGRGYPRILIDLLLLMRLDDATDFLAHELFHAYRGHIARPLARPFGDDLLVWALNNAENEGIADLLDKGDVPRLADHELARRYADPGRRAYYAEYRREYGRSGHWLRYTEGILERVADRPERAAELGRELHRELPDNGRVLGAFMAATIRDRLGTDRLIAVVGDTFGFWRAYNEAAARSEGQAHALSELAMRAIDRLEATYTR